jgi:hypothetical protein
MYGNVGDEGGYCVRGIYVWIVLLLEQRDKSIIWGNGDESFVSDGIVYFEMSRANLSASQPILSVNSLP